MALLEKVVFPVLSKKMDLSTEKEQHQTIHKALDELTEYIKNAKKDTKQFDALKLKGMMTLLREPLVCSSIMSLDNSFSL